MKHIEELGAPMINSQNSTHSHVEDLISLTSSQCSSGQPARQKVAMKHIEELGAPMINSQNSTHSHVEDLISLTSSQCSSGQPKLD
ncbi:hypothetical protein CPC08DRAFT_760107 [Agrocybe pediades]|nr:hypothetical protein CPC08DRAFT_760107 [Agrocybe pediades]